MNWYYSITDSSAAYQIAMGMYITCSYYHSTNVHLLVLYLDLKLDYFCVQEWEEEWINVAENLVCEEYIDVYENCTAVGDDAHRDDEVSGS